MKIELIVYSAIGFLSAGLIAAALVSIIHRRAIQLTTRRLEATLAQATRDLQTNLEQLRNETNRKVVELEQAIDALKIECAATNIELVPLKAQAREKSLSIAPKINPSESEDTWTRGENSADISIVPTARGSNDNETWVRDGSAPDPVLQRGSATQLATVFSQGNLSTVAKQMRTPTLLAQADK
jgi:hypothetical protein